MRRKGKTGGACPIGASGRREGGWNLEGFGPRNTLFPDRSDPSHQPIKKRQRGWVDAGLAIGGRVGSALMSRPRARHLFVAVAILAIGCTSTAPASPSPAATSAPS